MITSWTFWGFLVVAAFLYWNLPKYRDAFLFLASAGYVATLDWRSAIALVILSGVAFGAGRAAGRRVRGVAVAAIVVTLGYLAYFKYLPPIVAALSGASPDAPAKTWAVPLGASYFTFKLIHYIVDASRDELPRHDFWQFIGYIFFFPSFAAGPIEPFEHYLKNTKPRFSSGDVLEGGTRILYGVVKKAVLVDLLLDRTIRHDTTHLARAIPIWMPPFALEDLVKALPTLPPAFAWQFVITRFVSSYLDFSAYSDIAIGGALLFGIRLGENFNFPIFATNPGDFWKRWHMSLSSWCQRYVYLPVMARTRSPYVAVYCTMLAMGIWHGGNLNYVCWGLYHATLLAVYSTWLRIRNQRRWRTKSRLFALGARVATLVFIVAASAFSTTAPVGVGAGFRLFALLFGFHTGGHS